MLSINTNLSSLIAQNSMKSSSFKLDTAIERMTTGYKINHASDNAANYSIATNMQTQIGSYNVAADNVAMGMDLVTTASDTVSLMQDKAQRLRVLCTQARNGTFGAQSLAAINAEANAIVAEIDRIYSTAQYNGVSLFTGGTEAAATPEVATFAMRRSAEPEMATFAMRRSAEPEMATFATPRATSSWFIEEVTERDTTSMVTMTQLAGGITSADNEYSISTKEELVALANYVNSGKDTKGMTFVLGADIDLSSISNWTPIGDYSTNSSYLFKGTFDGNGHVIKNLKIDRDADHQGLFGYAYDGSEIKNIGLEGGSVKGSMSVGSLAGTVARASISNSYATGAVSGTGEVGGLVGMAFASSISNSYATGDVTATGGLVGGLVGRYNLATTISNSCATGTVSGTRDVGGLVGGTTTASSSLLISNSYATGAVSGTDNVGGLVGGYFSLSFSISNSYATGAVTGTSYAGGLVGRASSNYSSNLLISNSYATGAVSGTDYVGGLVGYSSISISNSYATGAVTGTSYAGGLVGENTGSITNSAAVQTDLYATLMTEDQIKSTYTLESMGFTEANGWTASGEHPILTWQTTMYTPTPPSGGGSSSGGSYGVSAFNLQIGTYGDSSCQIGFDINFTYDLSAIELDISSDEALDTIDNFIIQLSEHETTLGAVQNRLESALESISVNIENLTSSLSTIRDADIAEVSSQYIQQQILQQAAATLMSTANQSPAIALQLI